MLNFQYIEDYNTSTVQPGSLSARPQRSRSEKTHAAGQNGGEGQRGQRTVYFERDSKRQTKLADNSSSESTLHFKRNCSPSENTYFLILDRILA